MSKKIEFIKLNLETLAIGFAVGIALGALWGYKYLSNIDNRKCVITTNQILSELNKLPLDLSSATIQIPFIKQNGQWIGYQP